MLGTWGLLLRRGRLFEGKGKKHLLEWERLSFSRSENQARRKVSKTSHTQKIYIDHEPHPWENIPADRKGKETRIRHKIVNPQKKSMH